MRSNSDPLTVDEVKLFVDAVPAWYRDVYDVWPEFTRATVALHHRCLFAKACPDPVFRYRSNSMARWSSSNPR